MSQTKEAVQPQLHPDKDVAACIRTRQLDAPALRQTLAYHGAADDWESVYAIADALGLELSLLFDADDRVWVDIGTPGQVRLSTPAGARIPFRLWVHTHPRDAYWSATDRRALRFAMPVLERALVLGKGHYKQAHRLMTPDAQPRLSRVGPLSHWTDEALQNYPVRVGGEA